MTIHMELTPEVWERVNTQLQKDYPASVFIMRSKMQRVLGFVDRKHWTYNRERNKWNRPIICLDFYDERKRTFFLLKYSQLLDDSSK